MQTIHKKYSQGVSVKHPQVEQIIKGAPVGLPLTLDNVDNSIIKIGDGTRSNIASKEHNRQP